MYSFASDNLDLTFKFVILYMLYNFYNAMKLQYYSKMITVLKKFNNTTGLLSLA